MTNKNFMTFQTAVKKYVGIYEKSLSGFLFLFLLTEFNKKISKKLRPKSWNTFILV
jgi:hypothetical protein